MGAACGAGERPPGDAIDLRLEEITRYGTVDGVGTAFSSISGVALMDSTILVLEADPARVAVLDPDGGWLRDLGRPGEGPGELRGPSDIGVAGDTIWVGDPGGRRLEAFGRDGASVASYRWSIPADTLGAATFPRARFADGSVLAAPAFLSIGAAVKGRLTHVKYYRATREGEVLGELYRETVAADDFARADVGQGRMALGMHPVSFSPLVDVMPDGSGLLAVERPRPASAGDASFRIRVITPDGSDALHLEVPYQPVSAEGWRERHAREMEEDMIARSGSADPGFVSSVVGALSDRRFYPAVTAAVGGVDGSVWIRREETGAASVRWQVFTPDGALHGTFATSRGFALMRASLDEVWAVETNALDVPFLLRMRVVASRTPRAAARGESGAHPNA